MTDYNELDLVEAVRGEEIIRGRVTDNYCIGRTGRTIGYYELHGFTVTRIERVVPLPTEPGAYSSRTGSVHVLTSDGQWLDFSLWNGTPWLAPPTDYAPFVPLEPVSVTARDVLECIKREYGENFLNNSDPYLNEVAEIFGVTND